MIFRDLRSLLLGLQVLFWVLFCVACGPSPQAACKQTTRVTCDRLFDCNVPFVRLRYKDKEDCYTKVDDFRNCDRANPCAEDEYWDTQQAGKCMEVYENAECSINFQGLGQQCENLCKKKGS